MSDEIQLFTESTIRGEGAQVSSDQNDRGRAWRAALRRFVSSANGATDVSLGQRPGFLNQNH